MHQGQGWHHRGHGSPGCGQFENLGEEEIKKLDAERTAFFEATKDLRRKIYQKRLELASELAKEDPDAAAASALQNEVSDFKAQMAQQRLEHILRVRKINPDLGRGFWGGGPMGPGIMHCGMMEPGGDSSWSSGNRPCAFPKVATVCSEGMMHRGGCGMGSGYGGGPGMKGCGRSDRESSRQYHKRQGSQPE